MVSYETYLTLSQMNANRPPEQRQGQFMFNVLVLLRPDLADRIRCTDEDPFYDNDRIPAMLAWLAEHWNATEEP
jgi:hypothetical protein